MSYTLKIFIGCSIYVCSCSTPSFFSPVNSTPRFLMVRHFPILQIPVTRCYTAFKSVLTHASCVVDIAVFGEIRGCNVSTERRPIFDSYMTKFSILAKPTCMSLMFCFYLGAYIPLLHSVYVICYISLPRMYITLINCGQQQRACLYLL